MWADRQKHFDWQQRQEHAEADQPKRKQESHLWYDILLKAIVWREGEIKHQTIINIKHIFKKKKIRIQDIWHLTEIENYINKGA